MPPLPLAVVGHVEVVSFLAVDQLPVAGAVTRAHQFAEEPAGAAAVAAVQMQRLTGAAVLLFTALGRDRAGEAAAERLQALGLELVVTWRDAPTRRGVSLVDASGDRSIIVAGERLAPRAEDPLPWERLSACAGVFVTATDAAGLALARRAPLLTATPRLRLPVLQEAAVELDALIGSALDPAEQLADGALIPAPQLQIATAGAAGGVATPLGAFAAPQRERPGVDSYGAGDCFAAGVTAGLAAGWSPHQAISLGCHCGSACLDGFGPYASQLQGQGRADGGLSPAG